VDVAQLIVFSFVICLVNLGMVGKRKQFKKSCTSLMVETYVPKNNFYHRIKQVLNLDFLYQAVAPYLSIPAQ
jgi:hypothetical protein